MSFTDRVTALPHLGLGVSTEYGAGDSQTSLDPWALREAHPAWGGFLEVGVEVHKGLDRHAVRWIDASLPCTYHFLDVNLDEPEDLDARWLDGVRDLTARMRPAWMCGDAGMWHFGRRERGHMLLLPPILTDDAATAMAEGIIALREATGLEVLPENPPGAVFVGDLHLLDFFARVCDRADTGMLLDCAHLAIYQGVSAHPPTDGLDGFPLDRVVELHVAGASVETRDGYRWVEDDHTTQVLSETWQIFERVIPTASNLKAVVFECERNPADACAPGFARIEARLGDAGFGASL